jgi:DNA-binding CsgD family transcriptional regulator/tetratricopeptide (TPR) repeat protein
MSAGLVSPVLIGRSTETDRLVAAYARAADGQPAVVLLAGEAGVGKSRLAHELSVSAAERGARVLSGGCVQLGGEGIPLAPLVEALRALARSTPPSQLQELLGPARRDLARLLPELDAEGSSSFPQDGQSAQLFEHVLGLIGRLAADRPLVLIVEDLHWADRTTLDLLAFLVSALREMPVLLVLTYRSDELHRRHPLRPLVTAWERVRMVERLDLLPFSRADVAAQVQAIRAEPLSAALVDVVYERSQGNAFLVEEIVGAVAGGADPRDLPPSLRDVLLSRTETVSETAQRVLRTLSAGGSVVADQLLAAVTPLDETQLYDALREAVEHHLLVVDSSGRGYAFRHALTRDAVYDDMLPGERVRLHMAYGEALSADPTLLGDEASLPGTLAHHWYAALDLPRALASSVEAARLAAAAYAPAEARRHLDRALEIWPRVADAETRTGVDVVELGLLAVDAAANSGDVDQALSRVDQLLAEHSAGLSTERRTAMLERRALLLSSLGREDAALQQLREARTLLDPDVPSRVLAAVLASLARTLMRRSQLAEASSVAEQAVAAARAAGATFEEADASITLGSTSAYSADPGQGLDRMREGITLALDNSVASVALRGYVNLTDAFAAHCRHEEAIEVGRTGLDFAERIGHMRSGGAFLIGNLAESLTRLGRLPEAVDLLETGLGREPEGVFAGNLSLVLAEARLWQGDVEGAEEAVRAVQRHVDQGADVQFTASLTWLIAECARLRGDLDAARDVVWSGFADLDASWAGRYTWPLIWSALRTEADRRPAADPDRRSALLAKMSTLPLEIGPTHVYEQLTVAEDARLTGAGERAAWAAAAQTARAVSENLLLMYALYRLAQACAAENDTDAAGAAAAEALALAEPMAAALRTDIVDLIRRARLPVSIAAPEHPSSAGVLNRLTVREREVLALIAEGRSNAQIATALFISPKTASVHVSNILAKLEVSSRGEAAALMHRLETA